MKPILHSKIPKDPKGTQNLLLKSSVFPLDRVLLEQFHVMCFLFPVYISLNSFSVLTHPLKFHLSSCTWRSEHAQHMILSLNLVFVIIMSVKEVVFARPFLGNGLHLGAELGGLENTRHIRRSC